MKYMDIEEFLKRGYLLEVNRRFLHPLGLALEVGSNDEGSWISGIQDHRDDPEGVYFADLGQGDIDRAMELHDEWQKREPARVERLGYMVQPLEPS